MLKLLRSCRLLKPAVAGSPMRGLLTRDLEIENPGIEAVVGLVVNEVIQTRPGQHVPDLGLLGTVSLNRFQRTLRSAHGTTEQRHRVDDHVDPDAGELLHREQRTLAE